MVKFRFRAFRKFWLAMIAVVSLTCSLISISIHRHFEPKSNLIIFIVVPICTLFLSLCAIFIKRLCTSFWTRCVAVECIWLVCVVPFSLVLSLFAFGIAPSFAYGPASAPFLVVQVFCWLLTALLTIYSAILVILTFLAAATVDRDVWFRDITGSPSPYPFPVMLYHLRHSLLPGSQIEQQPHKVNCLPGCACDVKLPPSSPPLALPPIGFASLRADSSLGRMSRSPSVSSVPVRIPTAMERHNSIVIGFDV